MSIEGGASIVKDALAVIRDLTYFDGEEDRAVLELLAEYLQTTSDEVTAYGTPGSVTLKIAVKPLKEGGSKPLGIIPSLSRTPAKPALDGVIRFNRNGRLSRADDRQPGLPLRSVETPAATVRESGADISVREA